MISRTQARLAAFGPLLSLALVLATGADAQETSNPVTGFLKNIFGGGPPTSAPAEPAPKPAASGMPTSSTAPATVRRAARSPEKPAPRAAIAAAPATATAAIEDHPAPPRRPAAADGAQVATAVAMSSPAAEVTRVATAASPVKPATATALVNVALPTTPAAALDRVNTYLNSFETITGNFVQHNPDGHRAEGTIYVQRPGRLRFKYEPPSTLEVVADGRSVAVRDTKLKTQDVYAIGQTPLKFLLKDHIDLAVDTKVLNVSTDPGGTIRVHIEDRATIGGTSKITLVFDAKANQLKQWNIIDAQGYKTSVSLYNIDLVKRSTP